MQLIVENSNELINLLLEKMSKFGMNYKINKQQSGPKAGIIPAIDIETVEKTISELETQIENNPDFEHVEYLMVLYEKVFIMTFFN
jgi:hypothetical protein